MKERTTKKKRKKRKERTKERKEQTNKRKRDGQTEKKTATGVQMLHALFLLNVWYARIECSSM